jgi:hypothetical protein
MDLVDSQSVYPDKGFIQCCPTWIIRNPAIHELVEFDGWFQEGNLPALYTPDTLPVALKNAYKTFSAGLSNGKQTRRDDDKRRKRKS